MLGPSSSERWLNCGGGTGTGQSEYAAEGSAAHWLSEQVRLTGRPTSEWKGKTLQSGSYEFKVGKPLIDSVTTFVESVEKLPGAALIEERVSYEDLVPGGFGTLDDARLHADACVITDFKHGKGVEVSAAGTDAPARGNTQLKLYALGVFFKYDWLYRFTRFVLRISQPRRGVAAEREVFEVKTGDLLAWGYDVVRPRAKLLLEGKLKNQLQAGPWCKFCGRKNDCEVRAAYKIQHDTGSFQRDADSELVRLDG